VTERSEGIDKLLSNSKGQSVAKFFGQTLKAAPESIKRSSVFDERVKEATGKIATIQEGEEGAIVATGGEGEEVLVEAEAAVTATVEGDSGSSSILVVEVA
jgi:hypothetical protein